MSFSVRTAIGLALLLGSGVTVRCATVYRTLDAALADAFPGAELRRDVLYPDPGQLAEITKLAGTDIAQPVYRYRAYRDGVLIGAAYPDRHRVRTLPETVLVVVTPAGVVREVRVLAFAEPVEYLPGKPWYDQFSGKTLDPDLRLNRAIDGVTGATLTGRATTQCVRRALAVHRVFGAAPP